MDSSIILAPQHLGVGEIGLTESPKILEKILKPVAVIQNKANCNVYPLNTEKSLKNLNQIIDYTKVLSQVVAEQYDNGHFPITIGGDHSIALATVSAVASRVDNLGVIWIDAHGDMNTDKTTPSGNIHGMILASLQGLGHKSLVDVCKDGANIKTENIVIYGVRDLDVEEQELMDKVNVKYYSYEDIVKRGLKQTLDEAIFYLRQKTSELHISFDLDAFDPSIITGVSTPVTGGFNPGDAKTILDPLFDSFNVKSFDIVEYNPKYDINNQTRDFLLFVLQYVLDRKSCIEGDNKR